MFETLMLNMIRYPTDDDVMPHNPDDCPAWEVDDPFTPDRSIPRGYLDYLTWQNRRILLMPVHTPTGTIVQQMTVAPGMRCLISFTCSIRAIPLPSTYGDNLIVSPGIRIFSRISRRCI